MSKSKQTGLSVVEPFLIRLAHENPGPLRHPLDFQGKRQSHIRIAAEDNFSVSSEHTRVHRDAINRGTINVNVQSDPWEAVTMPRRHSQSNEDDRKSKKANKTAASEVMKRIEVIDPDDIKIIKRYDNNIGIVPIQVLSCQQPCGNHGTCCVIAISRSMGQ